jgi:hypothetical protein
MNLGLRDPAWLTYAVLPFASDCSRFDIVFV